MNGALSRAMTRGLVEMSDNALNIHARRLSATGAQIQFADGQLTPLAWAAVRDAISEVALRMELRCYQVYQANHSINGQRCSRRLRNKYRGMALVNEPA